MIRLCPVTNNGWETSSESKTSHKEENAPSENENVEIHEDNAEVLRNDQVGSDGDKGQDHSLIQNTLSGVSHIFGMHEETDKESNKEEKIPSTLWKRHQPSPKEDTPSKELSQSSSEEDQPTNKALHDKAQQWARQLDTNFDAW